LAAQAIVLMLFHHSLIKLYNEGNLTNVENNGGMGARNNNHIEKQKNYNKKCQEEL